MLKYRDNLQLIISSFHLLCWLHKDHNEAIKGDIVYISPHEFWNSSAEFGTGDLRWKVLGKCKLPYVISAFHDILGGKLKVFQCLSGVSEALINSRRGGGGAEPKSGMLSNKRLQYLLIAHCQIYISTFETPQTKFKLKTVTMFAKF
jgi:hypothetical protein